MRNSSLWVRTLFSKGFPLLFLILFLSSCASIKHKQEINSFNSLYSSGQYTKAANLELDFKNGKKSSDPSTLLQSLQAAVSLRYAKEYMLSSKFFDESEEIIKFHNDQLMLHDAVSTIGSVLVNDAELDYKGAEYDGIMVNTYKGLNFWQQGKNDLARIEFNRALDRQRRAKEHFAAEIKKLKNDVNKEQLNENNKANKKKINQTDLKKNVDNMDLDKILKEQYSNLDNFKPYPDFVNPFTTYIAGLFFFSEGDYSKALTLIKETYGMIGANQTVLSDLQQIEKIDVRRKKTHTWIIFENGLGPIKEEIKVNVPLYIGNNQPKLYGIALPRLVLRGNAFSHLTILTGKGNMTTQVASNMDNVIRTEFKKKMPSVVTRAIISSITKLTAQIIVDSAVDGASKKKKKKRRGNPNLLGNLLKLATRVYSAVSTAADIRIWSALPKEFQLAKMITPKDGVVNLSTPNGVSFDVNVPVNSNSLI